MSISHFLSERMLYIDNEEMLSYKKGKLIFRKKGNKIQNVKIGNLYNRIPLLERILRKEPRCAAKINQRSYIVSFGGAIYNYSVVDNNLVKEHDFSKSMNNPLEFLTVSIQNEDEAEVFYGEYIWNHLKGPVSIYKRVDGVWKKAFEFPENSITHIHNIIHDKYHKGFLILTGDENSESGIWFADYDFTNVEPLLIGSQQFRSCVAFPIKEGIIYATDTPLEGNYIYKIELDRNKNIIAMKKEYSIPGPCIYGTKYKEELYFATSVEPDSTLPKWRYRFTYKLGNGVKSRSVHIIKRNLNGDYSDICSVKKDIFPMWLFQFGNILFPKNNSRHLYAVLQSTIKGHGVTYKIES